MGDKINLIDFKNLFDTKKTNESGAEKPPVFIRFNHLFIYVHVLDFPLIIF